MTTIRYGGRGLRIRYHGLDHDNTTVSKSTPRSADNTLVMLFQSWSNMDTASLANYLLEDGFVDEIVEALNIYGGKVEDVMYEIDDEFEKLQHRMDKELWPEANIMEIAVAIMEETANRYGEAGLGQGGRI